MALALVQLLAFELESELETLTKETFNLRFQKASGQLENTSRVRVVRRDIARIKTILELKGVDVVSKEGGK